MRLESLVQIKITVLVSFDVRLSDVDENLKRDKNRNGEKQTNKQNKTYNPTIFWD